MSETKIKMQKVKVTRFLTIFPLIISMLFCSCTTQSQTTQNISTPSANQNSSIKEVNQISKIIIADSFAYPIGKNETVTEAKDKKDEWYNAQNFGENNHLGEDWNKNSGGNTDCGEPVYATANGTITFAQDAGIGWGNVLIIEHNLPDGTKVESLYGHLLEILKTSGEVKKREQIGKVGNANGRYPCHLHFEIRLENCPMWNQAGGGYDSNRTGWTDPSEFIDKHRKIK